MTRDEALRHCQAYLDRQLDAKLAAEIEQAIKSDPELARAYENQRSFQGLLGRASANAKPSNDFQERLRARLAASGAVPTAKLSDNISPPPIQFRVPQPRWRWGLIKLVAVIAFATGIGLIWHALSTRECPYMVACAQEHAAAVNGKTPLDLTSADPKALETFVAEKTKATVNVPADLRELKPIGAGVATFASLRSAPKGVFVRYDKSGAEPVTVLLHPWPEETPTNMNRLDYKGREFWAARHGEYSVASWKSPDGKLLCSVISRRPKDEVLDIAFDAGDALSKKSAALREPADAAPLATTIFSVTASEWR